MDKNYLNLVVVFLLISVFNWSCSQRVRRCNYKSLDENEILIVQFPQNGTYEGNIDDCLVVAASPSEDESDKRVKLKIQYFDVEHHYACDKDYLEIRDGRSSTSELLGKWCGVKTDESVQSSGRYLYLRLVTDEDNDANFARGFKLVVSTVTVSSIAIGLIIAINVGILILLLSFVVVCVKFVILPRRLKRQQQRHQHVYQNEAAQQRQRSENVPMGGVGLPMGNGVAVDNGVSVSSGVPGEADTRRGSQVVGEPPKPPSYTCAVRDSTGRPEMNIPNRAEVVPSAPPPTYTCAIRDPPAPRATTAGIYPQLENSENNDN